MSATIPVRFNADVYGEAIVDDVDLALVTGYRWSFTGGYVCAGKVAIHRLLLGLEPGDGKVVDHKNGNRLDNRRENLRVGTQAQNAQNRLVSDGPVGGSRFRGVRLSENGRKWVAAVGRRHLGTFRNELDAARVAAEFRAEHMPWSVEDPALLGVDPVQFVEPEREAA